MNENQTNQDNFELLESPTSVPNPTPAPVPTWDIPIEKQFATTLVSHDTFFELVFQLQRVACALLRFLLPQQLLDEIDLDKLTVSVRHFRDGNFQESR
ncbi:MAG: Rpn family recombination-promoting nuclease/putative transposase, partial [Planctomycetaceae bacterium]|nr:Rpn family recombination-promoting nuclease/putative transposase [Planctomycetaceae bacterium]